MLAVSESVTGIVMRLGCATATKGAGAARRFLPVLPEAAGGGSEPNVFPAGSGMIPRPMATPTPSATIVARAQIQGNRFMSGPRASPGCARPARRRAAGATLGPGPPVGAAGTPVAVLSPGQTPAELRSRAALPPAPSGGGLYPG